MNEKQHTTEEMWNNIKDAAEKTADDITDPMKGYDAFRPTYREHYDLNYAGGDNAYAFDRYEPAYYFGYKLATEETGNWETLQPKTRQGWEMGESGTWEMFKDAIYEGYQAVRRSLGDEEREYVAPSKREEVVPR